ncbi:MAG: hypothetical protein QW248_05695 [Candidatus Nitrosocaldus sp.]
MAEAFMAHIYAMAGTFVVSTAIWFSIRASRGRGGEEINRNREEEEEEEKV